MIDKTAINAATKKKRQPNDTCSRRRVNKRIFCED
jgi:hypothetical protein